MTNANEQQTKILQVTQTMFGATPGATYLQYFEDMLSANPSVADLAQSLSGTTAFYGKENYANLNSGEFASAFVNDLIGNHATASNKAWAMGYIVEKMATGTTQAGIISELTQALSSVGPSNPNWGNAATIYNNIIATKLVGNLVGNSVTDNAKSDIVRFMVDQMAAGQTTGKMVEWAIAALDGVPHSDPTWGSAATLFDNRIEVSKYFSVDKANAAIDLGTLQQAISGVTAEESSVAAAKALIDNTATGTSANFTLTTFTDHFVGGDGNDTFNATMDQATPANGTLNDNVLDTLTGGGGTDTLNITPTNAALTSGVGQFSDALFTNVSAIENIVIITTGTGAQTITTGPKFDAAFTAGANLTTTSTTGAQTIVIATGSATVKSTATTGELHISGGGIATVTSISDASTANGGNTYSGTSLATVTATSTTGAQTIITGAAVAAAHVTMTTGDTAGNTITTGSGNDTIVILASGVAASTVGNTITAGTGADAITLALDASKNTIVIGDTDSGITIVAADRITNFVAATDLLKMGTVGDATATTGNYVEAGSIVPDYAAALVAANVVLATLHGGSAATELYAFQWDATNGYLFNDVDGNGTADQIVVLVGINDNAISAANIIA